MLDTLQTDVLQIELLAREILVHLENTDAGHCARVDFLDRSEALSVCQYIVREHSIDGVLFRLLASHNEEGKTGTLFITTDKAIEIRNRKQEGLCLFIPSDLVDAAYSSIANSFALIDGRTLHALVLKQVLARLSPELASLARTVFARLRGLSGVSDEQRLDFALFLYQCMRSGETKQIGLELWRVGLIADGSDTFVSRLDNNRDCMLGLSRPNKLGATTQERIESIKVDTTTATALGQFFHGRSMNDVRSWSRELAKERVLTFDHWVFPKTEPSDMHSVSITPFVNAKGEVERYCHLSQPDGAKGSLLARYGAKETLTVRWKTEPQLPKDLSRWRVGIVPSGSENGFEECIEEQNVAGKRRTVTIKLDLDFDEPPDYGVCIRVAPIGADGIEIINQDTQEAFFADSHEFFLVKDLTDSAPEPPRQSLRTVPTLAFGRLEVAVDMRETVLAETEPEWITKDLEYFRLRLNDRRVINIGLSGVLLALQKQILAEPRGGGCFILDVDEVRPVDIQRFSAYPLLAGNSEPWSAFWRAREAFFKRLKQSDVRAVIEAADWTPELATSGLRYAQSYHDLIDELVTCRVNVSELRQALSLDTLLIRNTRGKDQIEEAVVVLPTHPLRAAWFTSYTQLLHEWEEQLLDRQLRERKQGIDLQALRLLVPTNVPAFAYHAAASTSAFAFFQNLRFFHGVALPADVPDPHRRYEDVATLLDTGVDQVGVGDIQPDHLAEHLTRFHQSHPYAQTLVTTLINPDRGDFFAEALKKFLRERTSSDEAEQIDAFPAFQIISYAEEGQKSTFQALEQVRQQQIDQHYGRSVDHFLPGLTITARTMGQLEQVEPPEAHIAVVTDFTRPAIVASTLSDTPVTDTSSFSLYGLVSRFVSQFTSDSSQGLLWRHRILTEGVRKPEPHPAGQKYSEALIGLHTSLLNAGGYLLGGGAESYPVLEVRLEAQRRDLLERLHANTNWVITLDRFFTLDYYDSPKKPGLDGVARKYVID